jgi:hypothetical protein
VSDANATIWQFNSDLEGWNIISGSWTNESSKYMTTLGIPGKIASVNFPTSYTAVAYEVDMTRNTACEMCWSFISIRGQPAPLASNNDWNSSYDFGITADGYYSVWKTVNGVTEALQSEAQSPYLFKGNATNILKVVASSSNLSFYINDNLVWSGTDTDLSSGVLGIKTYQNGSDGYQMWIDWATLDIISGDQLPAVGEISSEQLKLNQDAINKSGVTDSSRFYR